MHVSEKSSQCCQEGQARGPTSVCHGHLAQTWGRADHGEGSPGRKAGGGQWEGDALWWRSRVHSRRKNRKEGFVAGAQNEGHSAAGPCKALDAMSF